MVRDFVKWDDAPVSLQAFGDSAMRAHQLAVTAPMEPVLLVADAELQEEEVRVPGLRVPRPTAPSQPAGEAGAVAKAADMLVQARSPLIVVDKTVRSQAGVDMLVRLAESLNAPVVDLRGRMNFPNTHYLNQSWLQGQLVSQADVLIGLDLADLYGVTNAVSDIVGRPGRRVIKPDCKVIHVSPEYLMIKSNHGDFERYFAADLAIAADAETTLPALLAAVEQRLTPERRQAVAARRPALEDAYRKMRAGAVNAAARGWDLSPISTARVCMEVWDQIKDLDWALVSSTQFQDDWPHRLWSFDKFHQYIGGAGGYGVGYQAPAAVGAALAHKQAGRIAVNFQGDGDFLCAPGSLWTLAHHQIPLLTLMHNNRAWHQETMHLQRMTNRRQRHPERARIGTVIQDPNVDYALIARGQGVWAEGPIEDPAKLGPAIARALAVVKSGKPALLDVVTQPR
jgi:thiamine pyrophosphate-dependent acetolactate synthase large subunit-like protein